MPDPGEKAAEYERKSIDMIRRYVGQTDGRAFVLFTSYEMMKRAGAALRDWLEQKNLSLYSQGDGMPRTKMLDLFKQNPHSVLFGVESFWQGVDVPGDALQNVVIPGYPSAFPTGRCSKPGSNRSAPPAVTPSATTNCPRQSSNSNKASAA